MTLGLISWGASCNFGDAISPMMFRRWLATVAPNTTLIETTPVANAEKFGLGQWPDKRLKTCHAIILLGGSWWFPEGMDILGRKWLDLCRSNNIPLIVWGGTQYALDDDHKGFVEDVADYAELFITRFSGDAEKLGLDDNPDVIVGSDLGFLAPTMPHHNKLTLVSGAELGDCQGCRENLNVALRSIVDDYKYRINLRADPTCTFAGTYDGDIWEDSHIFQHMLLHSCTSKFMVSSKLHPLIYHLAQGRLGIGIGARGKIMDLLADMNLSALGIDISERDIEEEARFVPHVQTDDCLSIVEDIKQNRNEYIDRAVAGATKMRKRANTALDAIAKFI